MIPSSLTVVAIGPATPTPPPCPRAYSDLLYTLTIYLLHAFTAGKRPHLTLVNLEAWYDVHRNDHGVAFCEDIRNDIRRNLGAFRRFFVCTYDPASMVDDVVSFMSLEEYRESVGEERFQFETELVYK
jgi:hypothetical protein